MRVCFVIKRSDHNCSTPLYLRCCRGCGFDELTGSRVLFLWEQVRDLLVQEFFRELVVSVAALSDLAGSIIVETFIVLKAGT